MKTRREMRYAILVESIFAPDGHVVFRLRIFASEYRSIRKKEEDMRVKRRKAR